MYRKALPLVCALVCVFFQVPSGAARFGDASAADRPDGPPSVQPAAQPSGRDLFFSDSLNAYFLNRPYPVPDGVVYTPAPEGYEPVYITSYARHGSRKLYKDSFSVNSRRILAHADSLGGLTPFGKDLYAKIVVIDDDLKYSAGDLTRLGAEQHKGIAERMYRNYPGIFSTEGTSVRFYSTVVPRAMMSMFAANERLVELNPTIVSTRQASNSLRFMARDGKAPAGVHAKLSSSGFVRKYMDLRPAASKIFTPEAPALRDTAAFLYDLYFCGTIVRGMDLENVEFIWDLFSYDELYILDQAHSLGMYNGNSNSPELGDYNLSSVRPLLRDFVDRADAALAQEIPGADLRFGHDTYLTSLNALMGVNGFVVKEEDPLKVIDTYQDFNVVPMAGNVQLVYFRNAAGDVLVKVLRNEREASLPVETDLYPYYHWDDVRAYFLSRCE